MKHLEFASAVALALTCRTFYCLLGTRNLQVFETLHEGDMAFLKLLELELWKQVRVRLWERRRHRNLKEDQPLPDCMELRFKIYISSYFNSTKILEVERFEPFYYRYNNPIGNLVHLLPGYIWGASMERRYRMKNGALFMSANIPFGYSKYGYKSFSLCPHLQCYSRWQPDAIVVAITDTCLHKDIWSEFVNVKDASKELFPSCLSFGLRRCQYCPTEYKVQLGMEGKLSYGSRHRRLSRVTIWKDFGHESCTLKSGGCSLIYGFPIRPASEISKEKPGRISAVFEDN